MGNFEINMENKTCLDAALWYLKERSYSVIPVGINKLPLVSWKKYQLIHPTQEEVMAWWQKWPDANVGLVTGQISNLTVIDIDDLSILNKYQFPETFTVLTGKGQHFYYQFINSRNTVNIKGLKLDLRSEGGYVVAPPSKHQNGRQYQIINATAPTVFPTTWLEKLNKPAGAWKEHLGNEIGQGSRNSSFAEIIGGQIKNLSVDEFEPIGWLVAVSLNQTHNNPPLSEKELRTIFNSIASRERLQRSLDSAIKGITVQADEDNYQIDVTLEQAKLRVKVRNILPETGEGETSTWIEKVSGLTRELNFRLKLTSDSNKEQWGRLLSKAFDKKENKEVYPWTILVSEITTGLSKVLRNKKQGYALTEIDPSPTQWLLEPFIEKDAINCLFALGQSGKSLLAYYFAIQLAVKAKIKTLFIDYENTGGKWSDWIYQILGGLDHKGLEECLHYWNPEQIPLIEQFSKLKEYIKQNQIGLVVVDSASMATGESTSDDKAAIKLIAVLKKLKITCFLIAHQRKNEGDKNPIGTIQWENQARNVWNVASARDMQDDKVLHMSCKHTKANNTFLRKTPIGFKAIFNTGFIEIKREDAITYFEDKFTVPDRIIELLKKGALDYKGIAEQLGLDIKHVAKELSKLKNKGVLNNNNGLFSLNEKRREE